MTIDAWLQLAVPHLKDAGIQTARLDALVLLEDTLQLDKSYLLAHPEAEIAPQHLETLANHLERRDQHEPLAYIRGHAEFYGRRFEVSPDVLVPRPESESIIEMLMKHAALDARVADIGCGSGALAVTAALELHTSVTAVDVDEACLEITKHNAQTYSAMITLRRGDLLQPFLGSELPAPDVIMANLPYVPDKYSINEAARHEPALALFAGSDGLDLYRQMFNQVQQFTSLPKLIITEALLQQHDDLAIIAQNTGYKIIDIDGLVQVFTTS